MSTRSTGSRPRSSGARIEPHSRDIPRATWNALLDSASLIRSTARAEAAQVEHAILSACRGRFLSRQDLALLLGRSAEALRVRYLNRLVKSGALELEFPSIRNHPQQRYRAAARRAT